MEETINGLVFALNRDLLELKRYCHAVCCSDIYVCPKECSCQGPVLGLDTAVAWEVSLRLNEFLARFPNIDWEWRQKDCAKLFPAVNFAYHSVAYHSDTYHRLHRILKQVEARISSLNNYLMQMMVKLKSVADEESFEIEEEK